MTNVIKYLPIKFSGPRTYFSLLDKNNIRLVENWTVYKKELDQILKILLLTKDTVVIAASALCTEKAFDFFSDDKDKELLFKQGLIKPALRSQFNTFNEVYQDRLLKKEELIPKEVESFFSNIITEVVPWDLNENSKWYANRIEEFICNNDSLLRKELRERFDGIDSKLVCVINEELRESRQENKYFDRDRVSDKIKKSFDKLAADSIIQYFDLLYFISGSRVVNCENYIPQENLIYFSHSNFSYNKKVLSDKDIFYNVLVNIFLNSLYTNIYPIDVISNISYKDIFELRKKNTKKAQDFRNKYDLCLSKIENIKYAKEKDVLLKSLNELNGISTSLREQFKLEITDELDAFKSSHRIGKVVDSIWELIFEAIGSVTKMPISIVNMILNNAKIKKIDYISNVRSKAIAFKENSIRVYIKNKYKNDPIITSFLEDIVNTHKQNYLRLTNEK